MSLRKAVVLGTCIVLFSSATACSLLPEEEAELKPIVINVEKPSYKTITVQKREVFENVLNLNGVLRSSSQEDLSFRKRGGFLKGVYKNLGDTVKKGELIAELENEDIQKDIRNREFDLQKMMLQYEMKKENGAGKLEMEIFLMDVQKVKNDIEELKSQYDQTKLYASLSGIVNYIEKLKEKEVKYLDRFKVVAKIIDPNEIQVECTERVELFDFGQEVNIKYNDVRYKGMVVAGPKDAPKDADQQRKSEVIIKVEGLPADVGIGDRVDIPYVTKSSKNCIVLPKNLVKTYNGRNYVFVLADGENKEERTVEYGVETSTEVEIVKGLEVGEKVIAR